MEKIWKYILLIQLLYNCAILSENVNSQFSAIDNLRNDFLNMEQNIWNKADVVNSIDPLSAEKMAIEVVRQFKWFDNRIQSIQPNSLTYGLEFLERLWSWEVIRTNELHNTYSFYEIFRREQLQQIDDNKFNTINFDNSYIDEVALIKLRDFDYNVSKTGNRIQEIIFNEHIFELALKEGNVDLCNLRQSPQQLLYNLYSTLAVTELKGYAMMQFAYMIKKLYGQGNMTSEAKLMRESYELRTERTIKAVKTVMAKANRELWICDPKRQIPGETYIEVTQLLQGYIENEIDLNKDNTCWESCPYYTFTKSYSCYKNLYCKNQRQCKGKVINCQYFDADMWICPANTKSNRRYDYIEFENGRVLGHKDYCSRGTTKVDSWWKWLLWRCSYCFCLCDEQSETSDRFFNLRNVEADVNNNKVITGLRFVKNNRIIHLQIQQGELLPRARIDSNTLNWVPVDNYSITDRGIQPEEDYHVLTWETRALDLDDLILKSNQVLTGIRFRKIGSHLNFEIQARTFNFTTGKLIDPKNQYEWIGNDNTDADLDNPRRQLRLNNPDIPTRARSQSAPDSHTNQFLHFVNTAVDKDAAQTTVPFIDAQPVVPQIPVPLTGAGIYHKGQYGFGGYVAPKVFTYDYTPHLIPPPKKYYFKNSKNEALHDKIILINNGYMIRSYTNLFYYLIFYQTIKFLF